MNKKLKKSRYAIGDVVVLTHKHAGIAAGHVFTVKDPYKKGRYHAILVEDLGGIFQKCIPTKYLRPLRR